MARPRRPPRRQASPVRVELLAQQGERHLDRLQTDGLAADIPEAAFAMQRRRHPCAATARCTRPTGLAAVPPPGPATPVTATAVSAWECAIAPSAIARATASLTAPCMAIRSARHAQAFGLGLVGVGDEAALDHVGGAGDFGQQSRDQAAGTTLGRRQPALPARKRFEQTGCLIPQAGGKHRRRSPTQNTTARIGRCAPLEDRERSREAETLRPRRASRPGSEGRRGWCGSPAP